MMLELVDELVRKQELVAKVELEELVAKIDLEELVANETDRVPERVTRLSVSS